MIINRDVGVIESVSLTTPEWVDYIIEGNIKMAVFLLRESGSISEDKALHIVMSFKREVVFARKYERD